MIDPEEPYLVLDIETETVESKPNPELDILKYVGFKFKDRHGIFHYTEKEKIQKTVDSFYYITGHNLKEYDAVVLKRHGIDITTRQHFLIDTMDIVENRFKSMLYMDLNQGDRSLRRLCEILKFDTLKGEFDYALLKKDKLEGEEYELLEKYLIGDLDASDSLYRYCYDLFFGFKSYMSKEDQERMCWLIGKPGGTAYKIICHQVGLPEEYNNDYVKSDEPAYSGGFVSQPYIDFVKG